MSALYVVPCGAAKLAQPAPAAQLYTSAHFQLVLRAARAAAAQDGAQVAILSALHGLVRLDTVLAPYDVTMRAAGSVSTRQLQVQLQLDGWLDPLAGGQFVSTLLPRAYRDRLAPALALVDAELVDLYADAPGIGYQRGVASRLLAVTL